MFSQVFALFTIIEHFFALGSGPENMRIWPDVTRKILSFIRRITTQEIIQSFPDKYLVVSHLQMLERRLEL